MRDVIVRHLRINNSSSSNNANTNQRTDAGSDVVNLQPPLDLRTLSQLWDPKPVPKQTSWPAVVGPVFYYMLVVAVIFLLIVLSVSYVALGARFGAAEAWQWLTGVAFVVALHGFVVEPIRIVLVAFYYTIFRKRLI